MGFLNFLRDIKKLMFSKVYLLKDSAKDKLALDVDVIAGHIQGGSAGGCVVMMGCERFD